MECPDPYWPNKANKSKLDVGNPDRKEVKVMPQIILYDMSGKLYFLEVFFTNSPPPVIKYESASRCFQLEEGPIRGLLHVCKIFVYLWITFVSSSTVRMGAPYAVFIMKSVNTINLDPAMFEGPKYSPEFNKGTCQKKKCGKFHKIFKSYCLIMGF